jgi:hypothetical protein
MVALALSEDAGFVVLLMVPMFTRRRASLCSCAATGTQWVWAPIVNEDRPP